jgi:hypothetical protein
MIHHLALPGRLQSFRRMTSCNIVLSSERSATIFFNVAFSSSTTHSSGQLTQKPRSEESGQATASGFDPK